VEHRLGPRRTRDENRQGGRAHDVVGDAAVEDAVDSVVATSSDHDEIGGEYAANVVTSSAGAP